MRTDPQVSWRAWRSRSSLRFDPLANYEFGLKVGQRMAYERATELVPLLEAMLVGMGSRADLTGVDGSGHGGVPSANAVPDLTVGSSAAQVGT